MTRTQAIDYVKTLMTKETFNSIMSVMEFDKPSAIAYLGQMGVKEEVLLLL